MIDELMRQIDMARRWATDLAACDAGVDDALLGAIDQLHGELSESGDALFGTARGRVAVLAGYIQATAYCLNKNLIAAYEVEANEAARQVGHAATRILVAMNRDYGELPVS